MSTVELVGLTTAVQVTDRKTSPRARKRPGAFGAKRAIVRAAGYPLRLAPGEVRTVRQRQLLEQAGAVWHARQRLARAVRGLTVRRPNGAGVATVAELRKLTRNAERTLTALVHRANCAS